MPKNKKTKKNPTLLKRAGGTKAIPQTTQQVLPYIEAFDNGVMHVEPGVFSETFEYEDISFRTKSDDEQQAIYEAYMRFLNTLNPKEDVYFTFVNGLTDSQLRIEQVAPIMKGDEFDVFRKEMSDVIRDKMTNSRNNIETKKYITIKTEADSVDAAMARFNNMTIETDFKRMTGTTLHKQNLAERLEVLNNIMNAKEKNYWFEHDKTGHVSVNFDALAKQGLTTKDLIAPDFLSFKMSDFQIGERYGQAMCLSSVANWMNTNFLAELVSTNFESVITMHIEPIPQEDAVKLVHNQSVNINAEIIEKQKSNVRNGFSPEFLPADTKRAKEQIDQLQEDLANRDQKLFYMSIVLIHLADDKEELKKQRDIIKNTASKFMSQISPLIWQQKRGFSSALPMGIDQCYAKRLFTTESMGVFMPFDEMSQFDIGGIYYGVNPVNKSVIIYDRLKGQNYNGLVLGTPGSGKSFSAKREMTSVIMNKNADVCIVDPDGEYTPLAETFHGTVVKIAPGNGVHINPLDLDVDTTYDKDLNPISMKTDFVYGILETMLGSGMKLTPTQKAIVDRCIHQIYNPYLEYLQSLPPDANGRKRTIDRDHCPTLQSLFECLLSQGLPEAQHLALVMEPYTTGTFDTFAYRTNVDLDSKLIVYDISNIGSNLMEIALKVCMNDVWNRIIENRKKDKWTWFYVDEFHLLLNNPSTADYLKSIWKRARKFRGVPTGITQNMEEMLASPSARAIINNTSFVYMLNQSAMDRNILQDILSLSDTDMEFVTNVECGQGLLFTIKQAIPFNDNFPTDTKLYKVMTTKATEEH